MPAPLNALSLSDVVPARSVTGVTSWIGFLAVLVFVAASMFAAGWTARGRS
jgi:hypothetical protein